MTVQFLNAQEAMKWIDNDKTVAVNGFVGAVHPEALTVALEQRFINEGAPRNLTLVYAAGQGDGQSKGLNHLAHAGLIKRVIGGHWGLAPKLGKLANDNLIEAYNFPQGVIAHLFRDIAAGKVGNITQVGLHTFVDPRQTGGKLNLVTTENLVELISLSGQDYLLYKSFPIDLALIRGTSADKAGNISMEKEAMTLETLAIAQAVKNSGGKVIVQVERIVETGELDPKLVVVPNICVDAVVVSEAAYHEQTFAESYNPAYTGEVKETLNFNQTFPLDERKVIARRALMELEAGSVINLGIGVPEGIGYAAREINFTDFTVALESGPVGGTPARGLSFGASWNPSAIINQPSQFDFIDGGGIDIAFLGMAEADSSGHVNVSKYGPKVTGCGGFINISQNAKKVVFCGTFTAGGLKVDISDGKMKIIEEGRQCKFVEHVEQITFNGPYAYTRGLPTLYITERAVFELDHNQIKLIEIAPGIDLQRDILNRMSFKPRISDTLKRMDAALFL
jgi:propionate CoA-transferase